MTITLTQKQQAWFEAHVARGDFATVEDAVRQFVDDRIAEHAVIENDDLAWAKPYVDEALADVASQRVMPIEEHLTQLRAHFSVKT